MEPKRLSSFATAASLWCAANAWAQGSPAIPTSQEVPPPVPPVQPRGATETPASTHPASSASAPVVPPVQPAPAESASGPTPAAAPTGSTNVALESRAGAPVGGAGARADAPAPGVSKEAPGVRRHDGFFARASMGFGGWHERVASETTASYGGRRAGRTTGIANLGDLTVGGTPARGLVLGASFQTTDLLASTFRQTEDSQGAPPSELDPGLRRLLTIGPHFIWYLDDREGFNLGGGLGLAILTPGDASTSARADGDTYAALGGALDLEVAQHFWISEQFSLGVRGRLVAAIASGEDAAGVRWVHLVSSSPSVLVDVVFH